NQSRDQRDKEHGDVRQHQAAHHAAERGEGHRYRLISRHASPFHHIPLRTKPAIDGPIPNRTAFEVQRLTRRGKPADNIRVSEYASPAPNGWAGWRKWAPRH